MKVELSYDIEPKEIETFCNMINHVVDIMADVEIKESMTCSKIERLEKLLSTAAVMMDKFESLDIEKINKIDKIKTEAASEKKRGRKQQHNFKEVE